jgi:hypothetical protein
MKTEFNAEAYRAERQRSMTPLQRTTDNIDRQVAESLPGDVRATRELERIWTRPTPKEASIPGAGWLQDAENELARLRGRNCLKK